jgi:hypothetical protein
MRAPPAVGAIIDGHRFLGGDPRSQESWEPIGAEEKAFASTFGREQAKRDVENYANAQAGIGEADATLDAVRRGRNLLDSGMKTGSAAWIAQLAGRTPVLDMLPGVKDQSTKLDQFAKLGNAFVLGDAKALKPLSNSDIAWLEKNQINIGANPDANRKTLDAYEWSSNKRKAYAAAMNAWTQQLGSPSAKNARGETFEQFFSDYSNRFMPNAPTGRPGTPYNGEYRKTPPQAPQVPPPNARKAGQVYMTPKGPLRWTGTGWVQ